jgi:type IV secretion system protein VirB2
MKPTIKRILVIFSSLVLLTTVRGSQALAAGSGPSMPWNGPLQNLLDNLSGPTARTLGMLMFVLGALLWGFSRNEEHIRRFGGAIFGCAIAIGVVALFNALAFQGATF